jgi:opacity protein-like surface antigen
MKKLFTTLLFVLGVSPVAFAQTKNTTEFNVTVGYNGASVSDNNYTADYRSGFNAGVGAEHYFSDSWSFKAKALYDQKGWANGYISGYNFTTTTDFNVDYLTVPLLANWHFGRTKNWYLNFGPYVSFLLNAKAAVNGQDVKSYFNSTDGGLDIGVGVKFPVADNVKFFIEVNGQGGVTDISKGNSGSTIRNSVSAINIGLNFK